MITVQACGHTLVYESTADASVDCEPEKWLVSFDEEKVALMRLVPKEQGWPTISTPLGRDKVQAMRAWIWDIARAHGVNAENILESKGLFVFARFSSSLEFQK